MEMLTIVYSIKLMSVKPRKHKIEKTQIKLKIEYNYRISKEILYIRNVISDKQNFYF